LRAWGAARRRLFGRCISVVDVAAAGKLLEARGVVFRGETVVIPGKVALAPFADPDGNALRFAGPPPGPSKD
jgi:hypothetical protein